MAIQSTSVIAQQVMSTAVQAAGANRPSRESVAAGTAEAPPASNAPEAARQEKPAPDPQQLQDAVERAQNALPTQARDITFALHDNSNAVVVRIIASKSDEVIRQIPSEEFLQIAEALSNQIESIRAGLLLEQKA